MAAKKKTTRRKSSKAPSPAQLQARKAFALAAKARSNASKKKAAKKNSPTSRRRQTERYTAAQRDRALARAKRTRKPVLLAYWHEGWAGHETRINLYAMPDGSLQQKAVKKNPVKKRRNKTIITKPKKVVVINPKGWFIWGWNRAIGQWDKLRGGPYSKESADSRLKYFGTPDDLKKHSHFVVAEKKPKNRPNPSKTTRRKYRNGYLDLVIMGHAKKTPSGWLLGGKTFKQGKGIVPASKRGYYLDRATGTVFSKKARNGFDNACSYCGGPDGVFKGPGHAKECSRYVAPKRRVKTIGRKPKRNADHRDTEHPIEVTKHYRSGPPGYMTPWQRAHSQGQQGLFDHGIKAAKKRNAKKKTNPAIKPGDSVKDRYGKWHVVYRVSGNSVFVQGGTIHKTKIVAVKKASGSRRQRKNPMSRQEALRWVERLEKQLRANLKRIPDYEAAMDAYRDDGDARGYEEEKHHYIRLRRENEKLRKDIAEMKKLASQRNPSVKSIRKEFAGTVGKTSDVFAPIGTPKNVAKLGKLLLIDTEKATIKPTGIVYLCADSKGKLHLCGSKNVPIYSGAAQSFGQVKKLEYETAKPHLYPGQGVIQFWHKLGEESGNRPTLYADGKGGLKFRGGSYKITREGIVD